jgi:hypothetical protein
MTTAAGGGSNPWRASADTLIAHVTTAIVIFIGTFMAKF